MIDADMFRVFFRECHGLEQKGSQGRRRSKNSGGGIAPAAIAGLIEGAPCTVNAFRTLLAATKTAIKG
jgi:hypothetical protein